MSNKKKFILITIILTIVMIIIAGIISSRYSKSMAEPDLTVLSGSTYDEALNYSVGDYFTQEEGTYFTDSSQDQNKVGGPANQACFHNDSLDTGLSDPNKAHQIVAKILIESDGSMTSDGNSVGNAVGGKALAYYGSMRCGGAKTEKYWDDGDILISLYKDAGLGSVVNTPGGTLGYSNSDSEAAKDYANGTDESYVGLVLVLSGTGGVQDKILVFGAEGGDPPPQLEVDKYISSINDGGVPSGSRAGQDDGWKYSTAPEVSAEDVVTFDISIENVGETDATDVSFTDSFDTECFDAISDGYCTISGASFSSGPDVNASGEITATISSIPAWSSATVTVKLKVKDIEGLTDDTIYQNKAQAGNSDWSYDYVKVLCIKFSVDKYITKTEHEKETTEHFELRAGKEDSEKSANPAPISYKDTLVYYHIVIKNECDKEAEITYTDTYDSVFTTESGTTSDTFTLAKMR